MNNKTIAEDRITAVCMEAAETDPIVIAQRLMRCGEVRVHGPEHHYLTAAALLTAYCNAMGLDKGELLEKARIRATKIPPAVCGLYGVCGATQGAGCFLSVVLGTTYLSGREWQINNRMTAYCQMEIAESPGPRCCKRSTLSAVKAAARFLREEMHIGIKLAEPVVCTHSARNETCLGKACPFNSGKEGENGKAFEADADGCRETGMP